RRPLPLLPDRAEVFARGDAGGEVVLLLAAHERRLRLKMRRGLLPGGAGVGDALRAEGGELPVGGAHAGARVAPPGGHQLLAGCRLLRLTRIGKEPTRPGEVGGVGVLAQQLILKLAAVVLGAEATRAIEHLESKLSQSLRRVLARAAVQLQARVAGEAGQPQAGGLVVPERLGGTGAAMAERAAALEQLHRSGLVDGHARTAEVPS